MKLSNQFNRFSHHWLNHSPAFLIITLLAGACALSPVGLQAAEPEDSQSSPAVQQQLFATPDQDATLDRPLQTAATAKDQAALQAAIFGPEFNELLTGDKVQDSNNAEKFATAINESCNQVKDGDDKITP